VTAWGLPENAYLKAAYVGSKNVLDDGFQLNSPSKPLEIVISANGGSVEGGVTDKDGNAVKSARVVLVPDEVHRKREDLFKTSSTDQYGHFSLRGVPPGSYTVYAWEALEQGEYQDPDFLKQYSDSGKAIKISESSQMNIDLKVIPGQGQEGTE
jgi:protocatechuate 3,4-dioxygenase beta subunit